MGTGRSFPRPLPSDVQCLEIVRTKLLRILT